jgi:PPOX class probable F420-dependent enzyme
VGHLATVTSELRAHLVPCCFVLDGDTVYSAIDTKPKTTIDLRRVQNLRSNGAASLLVDHYDEDWTTLWWVRVDGTGRVVEDAVEHRHAIELLSAKYEQYVDSPPPGPVLAMDIDVWRMWPLTRPDTSAANPL